MGRSREGSRREAGPSERGTPVFRNAVQPWHLLVVLVVCLLVFGSKKLPDMARSLGKSMRILKSEARAMRADDAA
ncbi:twin-arginine translocation protein, TatA/E family subunit [Streptomyces sp. WM6373]|nr:twin-arginine translocation protein, TatA/E family subunit [Streptomyces sp. WM6373]KOU64472.1 twin-arginine translocation protein, TatA/E family subunit [Streptomyces sp. IGB124]KOU79647.1 twin-arginine translocation protein, TatA/E family subunit [Streptomyces sp. XY66]KOU80265.1 twin-arginine translocation protein, TatA/E family subunit [Streptomyces sp. XY58]KOV10204.1 twin-arginine translocation protein, TatA/E family subunit [Streptomyces sp. XY37]KOV19574.1 twin-arginine translocatio